MSHSNENYTTPFQPYALYTTPTSFKFTRTFTLKHTMLTEYLSSIRVAVTTKTWKLGHDRKLQQHLLSKIDFEVSPSFELNLTLRFKLLTLNKNIGKKHKIHCSRRKTQKHWNSRNFLHPLPLIQSPCLLLLSNTKPWEDEQSHHHWTPTLVLQSNSTHHITLWCCRNPGSCPWILCMLIMYFLKSQNELQ